MAAIPPNFGGDRQFIAEPEDAGLPTAIGDLTALLLRNLHMQRVGAAGDDLSLQVPSVDTTSCDVTSSGHDVTAGLLLLLNELKNELWLKTIKNDKRYSQICVQQRPLSEPKIVVIVDKWSLFRSCFAL